MNELTLFNDLFNYFGDDGYMMPSFNWKKTFPKVDVKEGKDSYILQMDLPGKTEKDVNVELNNNVLTISSKELETKNENKKDGKYLVHERTYSKFERSFALPDDVNGENISASVEDGVLTVKMPRQALYSPKHIAITVV